MPTENVARYAAIARLLRAVGAAGDRDQALRWALAGFEASAPEGHWARPSGPSPLVWARAPG
jgi:hypothetical protein